MTFLASDEEVLKDYVESGTFVTNRVLMENAGKNFSNPSLGGQNDIKVFSGIAGKVNGNLCQSTDRKIKDIWSVVIFEYLCGDFTKEGALEKIKSEVWKELGIPSE